MKPSQNRFLITQSGKTILRPQLRRGGNRYFLVVAAYTGGWSNWSGTLHYDMQEEAFKVIETACKFDNNILDDRFLNT